MIDKGGGDQVTFFPSTDLGEVERSQGVTLVHAWSALWLLRPFPRFQFHSFSLYSPPLSFGREAGMSQEYFSEEIFSVKRYRDGKLTFN